MSWRNKNQEQEEPKSKMPSGTSLLRLRGGDYAVTFYKDIQKSFSEFLGRAVGDWRNDPQSLFHRLMHGPDNQSLRSKEDNGVTHGTWRFCSTREGRFSFMTNWQVVRRRWDEKAGKYVDLDELESRYSTGDVNGHVRSLIYRALHRW